ncbi:MAG: LuxR family transcriptional regulator [Boseongicola sp.]|nr:LuxR family transcriptional regulator [Boseongicola sp.]MDD9976748.1 LuxR family transcriptional regulator [Boseongicola sp.]
MSIQVIKALVDAGDIEAVWSTLTVEMEKYGFDRLLYGFTRFRTPTSLGNREDMMVLTNHANEYVTEFFDYKVFRVAPMVQWASENTGAMSWRWMAENFDNLTPEQHDVLELNKRFDVTCGYTISFPDSSSRQKAAIALTARADMTQTEVDYIWEKHGEEIDLVNQIAHLKLASLPFPEALKRLSGRQKEVLEWVSDGKTTQDIADIMGLTAATVEKHLRKARESLQVDTTAQAVMKASLQRQIFVLGT